MIVETSVTRVNVTELRFDSTQAVMVINVTDYQTHKRSGPKNRSAKPANFPSKKSLIHFSSSASKIW